VLSACFLDGSLKLYKHDTGFDVVFVSQADACALVLTSNCWGIKEKVWKTCRPKVDPLVQLCSNGCMN
jgi:hypothetical protein